MTAEPALAVAPPQGEEPFPPAADPTAAAVADPPERPADLTSREREMLAFERQWWRRPGAKEAAIRDRFGLAPTRYYQLLNTLVDQPAALAADPLLVRRLRRLRAARGQRRSSRFLGNGGHGI